MADEDAKYKNFFNKTYLPVFTEYFSQAQLEKKITSYKSLIEEIKKIESVSSDSVYKHVLSKKDLLTSKNAKNLCRNGIQFKHFKYVIFKMFKIGFSSEDYANKIKNVFKGRSFSEIEIKSPTFSTKLLEERLPFHYLNEKGIQALKEVTWLLNAVLPKIEYCPMLLNIASLLLIFMPKEETYEVLRNIIESDQNPQEINKLRWHFRYTIDENYKLYLAIQTSLLDLAKEIQGKAKIIEEMGCPLFDLIQDMSENFFIEYVNFVGITRFLAFFLLEGAKGIYRLVYGILFYCNMLQDVTYVSANSGKGDLLETLAMKITSSTKIVEKKPIEEVIKIFRKNSNKIDNFSILLETATQLKLTHLNNNYITQVLPPSIRDKMPKITNLKYIPNFTPESKIFKKSEIEQLWELIPSDSNFKYSNAILIFDKEKNPECDLSSIYEIGNQMDDNSKILFLIQTTNDEVFGGFMEQNIKLTDKVKYITPPQSLLFSVRPEMKVYFPKETDEIVCFEPGAIRFGYGTDGPAISICFDLQEGQTEKDSVFGKNICLIKDGDEGIFSIKGLEIYLMP